MAPLKLFLIPSFATSSLAFFAAFTQQDLTTWAGALAVSILAFAPVYRRVMDEIFKSKERSQSIRRKDCEIELKREKLITAALRREVAEWKQRYDAGSRDHPKMG